MRMRKTEQERHHKRVIDGDIPSVLKPRLLLTSVLLLASAVSLSTFPYCNKHLKVNINIVERQLE